MVEWFMAKPYPKLEMYNFTRPAKRQKTIIIVCALLSERKKNGRGAACSTQVVGYLSSSLKWCVWNKLIQTEI
jgi:hypothetical protein